MLHAAEAIVLAHQQHSGTTGDTGHR